MFGLPNLDLIKSFQETNILKCAYEFKREFKKLKKESEGKYRMFF